MSPESQYDPAICFDGLNYPVVWDDWRGGTYGTRVTPAGGVLDPDGIVITAAADGRSGQGVSSDSTNFMVVWQRLR